MDNRLLSLIRDYQTTVKPAVDLLIQIGIERLVNDLCWLRNRIPQKRNPEVDAYNFKHGIGCAFYLCDGEFDFDFGGSGQIDCLDLCH